MKKDCCQGCKKGEPGQNKACQARLMVEKLQGMGLNKTETHLVEDTDTSTEKPKTPTQ